MRSPSSRAGSNEALNRFVPDTQLFLLNPWHALGALAADWGLIVVSLLAAAHWPHPWVYVAAAVVVARSQLALAVMMHESAHGVLLSRQWLNDIVGQTFAAGPLFLSLQTYRAGHLKHHLAPMAHDDPVAVVFGIDDYPVSRGRLAARLLADLCGVSYFVSATRMLRGVYRDVLPKVAKSRNDRFVEVASMLVSNGLLAGVLAWCGHPLLYVGLWLLPAVTLLPLMGRIRAILEHAGLPASDDQSQNARTITHGSWQTFLFGPHAIHYHIEHHLYVRMPFYHLSTVHRQLAAQQLLPARNLYSGYGAVLRDVSDPALQPRVP